MASLPVVLNELTSRIEDELVLLCVRTKIDAETSARIKAITNSPDEVDWDYVYQLARRHSVLPLIYSQLRTIAAANVPRDHSREGLLRSFSHFNHDEMTAVYILIVLALSPCGDAFSCDSWRGKKRPRRCGIVYGYPILLMRALLAWSYFSSALIKIRVAGLSYLSPYNLPSLAIRAFARQFA